MLTNTFKKCREDNNIKAKEVAKLLGISSSTLSCYENGYNKFPLYKLILFSNHYKISLDYLLGIRKDQKLTHNLLLEKEEIAKNLKRIRKSNNKTQKQIANVIGVSQSSYSRYEKGYIFPTIDLIIALCKIYKNFSPENDIFTKNINNQ